MQTNLFILWLLLFSTLPLSAKSERDAWNKLPPSLQSAEILGVDNISNLYAINRTKNELLKYDFASGKTYAYSNPKYGQISAVDVSSPLQIMVYYQSVNIIIVLDRTLSKLGDAIQLEDLGHFEGNLSCQSMRGGFWIFDPILNRVFYYDKSLNNRHKTPLISSLFQLNMGIPIQLLEIENHLFLHFPNKGVVVFDLLGNFYKIIFHENARSMSFHSGILYLLNTESITAYHLLTLESKEMSLLDFNVDSSEMASENIRPLLRQNKLHLFKNEYSQTITLNQ